MDINDFRTLATVLMFLAIVGIAWWAYSPGRKAEFDEAAQLPFDQEDDTVDSDIDADTVDSDINAEVNPKKGEQA